MVKRLYAAARLEKMYTPEEREHFKRSQKIIAYLERKSNADEGTASVYRSQLVAFSQCIFREYERIEVDSLIETMKQQKSIDDIDSKFNPYNVLSKFQAFLKKTRIGEFAMSPNSRAAYVKCAKRFLRFAGLRQITTEDFHEFVSLDRKQKNEKKGVEKGFIITLLNAADVQLRTFLMGNALFGPRPLELCAVRERDIDWTTGEITFRAEFSKMRIARKRKMNAEFKAALLSWRQKKYKAHRTMLAGRKHIRVEPTPNADDLVFAIWKRTGVETSPISLYETLLTHFHDLLKQVSAETWRSDGARREITPYTVGREFVRTHLTNALGNSDWAEFWMGHEHSTYYSVAQNEINRLSELTGRALTFLDIASIETNQKVQDARMDAMQKSTNEQFAVLMAEIAALKADKAALMRGNETREMYGEYLKEKDAELQAAAPATEKTRKRPRKA